MPNNIMARARHYVKRRNLFRVVSDAEGLSDLCAMVLVEDFYPGGWARFLRDEDIEKS